MKKPLTDFAIKSIQPSTKIQKFYDGDGLVLLAYPNGSKYWSFKYRWLGKEKSLSFGTYPETTLAGAREKTLEARALIKEGKDPAEVKKASKRDALIAADNSFEAIAREWMESQMAWSPRYAKFMVRRLEVDIFPKLGARPITAITAPELLAVIRTIEKRGALEVAHRCLKACGQIFMFGIATCRAERNPAADLKVALKTPVKKHYAHLQESELPEFLQKLEAYDGAVQTKLAVKLLLLTFVRTTELRGATWAEIDFDKAEWRIPPERMKMRRGHIVPLSQQAVAVLKELKLLTGRWQYVFPHQFKPIKCMSENTVLFAIYRMGYHKRTTGHGFRHLASTILNEHDFDKDHVELQLAHVEGNKVRGTYNHASILPSARR
jgi:integrase